MNEVVIKTHDFEVAKNRLKKFSQEKNSALEIESVSESGGFLGLGDHKVTGAELNKRLSIIQGYLIDINKINIDTVKEFGQVYNALEALDKDYIPAILLSIEAANKANDDVKEAQVDIRRILDNQKKTLEILKGFQKKIESYKHISDIDKLWGEFVVAQQTLAKSDDLIQNTKAKADKSEKDIKELNNFKNRIEKIKYISNVDELWNSSNILQEKISSAEVQIQGLISKLDIQVNSIGVLNDFKKRIDSVAHIKDVDNMWKNVEEIRGTIASICLDIKSIQKQIDLKQHTIQTLLDYKTTLEEYEHLKDIDIIWKKIEDTTKEVSEHDDKILECKKTIESNTRSIDTLFEFKSIIDGYEHLSNIDSMWNRENELYEKLDATNNVLGIQQKKIFDIEKLINEMKQNCEESKQLFSKKLRIAYAIAGSTMGIAIIELVLLLFKVI